MALAVSVVLAALELASLPRLAERPPAAFWVCVCARAGPGLDGALAGKGGRLYRLQPELVVGLRPLDHVEVYAGAGLAPAYLVRSSGGVVVASASGVVGVRLMGRGDRALSFLARAEGVGGGGAVVSLDLHLSFDL